MIFHVINVHTYVRTYVHSIVLCEELVVCVQYAINCWKLVEICQKYEIYLKIYNMQLIPQL